MMIQPLLGVS